MTSRNVIFYAALVGAVLPVGLWAAAETAAPAIDAAFDSALAQGTGVESPRKRLLMRLPNLEDSDLWYCMILMVACSLALPAGRKRFSLSRSLLLTLTAALTCLVAAVNLPRLVTLDDPDTPVRIAAHVVEAVMGVLVLLAFGIARISEVRAAGSLPDSSRIDGTAAPDESVIVGRVSPVRPSSPCSPVRQSRSCADGNRSHAT